MAAKAESPPPPAELLNPYPAGPAAIILALAFKTSVHGPAASTRFGLLYTRDAPPDCSS